MRKEAGGAEAELLFSGNALPARRKGRKRRGAECLSTSRAVLFQRRAELKQRHSSLSVHASVENTTRSTSREEDGMLLRDKSEAREASKSSPSNACKSSRADERARATSSLLLLPRLRRRRCRQQHATSGPAAAPKGVENAPGATERACSREGKKGGAVEGGTEEEKAC